MRERISLAVDELVAFANAKGGTVYMGVEDDGTVTGCAGYAVQKIMESIYDTTRPALFTEVEVIHYRGKDVLAIKVGHAQKLGTARQLHVGIFRADMFERCQ